MVLGVPTQGDFTWGSFMRAITDVTSLSGRKHVAGQDVARLLGKLGLIEAKQGGKTFAQLGAALSLRQFGADLEKNAALAEPVAGPSRRPGARCSIPGASTTARSRR